MVNPYPKPDFSLSLKPEDLNSRSTTSGLSVSKMASTSCFRREFWEAGLIADPGSKTLLKIEIDTLHELLVKQTAKKSTV